MRPRQRIAGWAVPLLLAPVLIAAYYALSQLMSDTAVVTQVAFSTPSAMAVAALCVAAWRQRRAGRRPWLFLACGQATMLTGDLVYYVLLRRHAEVAYPGPADACFLLGYIGLVGGLLLLVRRRTPGWDLPTVVDATIIAVSVALVGWVYLVAPMADAVDSGTAAEIVTVAYPVMDLVLLTLGIRLMLGAGARPAAFWLLGGWLLSVLVGDTAYSVQAMLGQYDGTFVDGVLMFAVLCLAAAGLHPSTTQLAERSAVAAPDATAARLAVLAVASLVAPVVLAVQYRSGGPLHVLAVVAACVVLFLLVLVRMAGLVRTQRMMAITDGLTGLRTRRYLEEALRVEGERVRRTGAQFGFLLVDVDHFKRVNDTFGHQAGDRVLIEVARRLRGMTRGGDVAARYGGEEFAVLLAGTTTGELHTLAQRLHRGLTSAPFAIGDGRLLTVTVSVGAGCLPSDADTIDELVKLADQALYAAKGAGRNRVVLVKDHSSELPGPPDPAPPQLGPPQLGPAPAVTPRLVSRPAGGS